MSNEGFEGIVGDAYGLQEKMAGRELYEAQVEATKTQSVAIVAYHQAKGSVWRAIAMAITFATLLGVLFGITLLVERWRS